MTINKELKKENQQEKPIKKRARLEKRYKTPYDLQTEIDKYFEECKRKEEVPNVLGLSLFLRIHRKTLLVYQSRPGYSNVVIEAKDKIEAFKIQKLYNSKYVNGVIFDLKCNHGWIDKQVIEQDITVKSIESLISSKGDDIEP